MAIATPNGQTQPLVSDTKCIVPGILPYRTLAIPSSEDDPELRRKYRPFLLEFDSSPDWVNDLELTSVLDLAEKDLVATNSRLKVLVLYGSLRRRSYSKLVAFEASRILFRLGCDVRIFNPEGLPVKNDVDHTHPTVQELRALSAWSDGHVWISPEQHGNLTAVFKNQIDWIPLSTGSIRPTQGRTLAIGQVCGGSQSFNAVNSLRILGRWMRMLTIPNQSSIPMAYTHFPDEGQEGDQRLKPSSNRDRLVDCMEEFVKYTILMRPHLETFGDRFRSACHCVLRITAEDLIRVRNNQRKSRERRKHHVAELEQKVKQLESAVAAAKVPMPSMSLAKENRILRTLLESIGFDSLSLEGYVQGAPLGGVQVSLESDFIAPAGPVAGVGFGGLEPGLMPTDQLYALATGEPSSSIQNIGLVSPDVLDLSYSAPTQGTNEISLDILQSQPPIWDTELIMTEDPAGILHTLGGETSRPANSVNGETTLCSVAFHLIIQCRRTGKGVLELETKLRHGYKMPAGPGEGCRVDNGTLLAVLAELQFSNANSVEDSLARAFGYSAEDLASLPEKANLGVSCGNPVAVAGIKEGETVVDLGSGAGIDVFLAAQKVGPQGKAIGVDMTEEMISLARRNATRSNLQNTLFIQSPITSIPLEDSTVDCIISNCVINLVPHQDKPVVFAEIARLLKPGGRVAVSDILARRELPAAILDDMALYVGCVAGASQVTEYRAWLEGVGLTDILLLDMKADINLYKQSSETSQGNCGAAKESVRLSAGEFADVDFNAWGEKLDSAMRLGAKGGVHYMDKNWEDGLLDFLPSKRREFDAVIDGTEGDIVHTAVKLLKAGGIVVIYGMTMAPSLSFPMRAILKNLDIRGTALGSRREFAEMVGFVREKRITPVIFSRVLNGIENVKAIEEQFDILRSGRQFGKLVIKLDAEEHCKL
ncbi:uncharacterized protein KD926_001159 [Aspergillus affinis]|uniref:uncharacterized protein n=1 Tax=Aspergillus affinis TaxID=1070780 RepID=UPI0022FE3C60|nr:uncharacterized protein KD926_001159 [Aspergillus affinis]KAI9036915.1 hypothetical protein KD926_001159 [Aspergillus affinis]